MIQLKNTARSGKRETVLDSSKLIAQVAKVLKAKGILESVKVEKGKIIAVLAYHKKEPTLLDLKLVSKPGLRKYAGVDEIAARKRRDASFLIVSTPKGILTSEQVAKIRVGGEVIAEIW